MTEKQMKPRVRGNEIRFFIDPRLSAEKIGYLLDWIATIIYMRKGLGVAIQKTNQDGGYRWHLGYYYNSEDIVTPNDWWADVGANGDAPNEVVIAYRYGRPEIMSKLRDVIIWLLDLKRFNWVESFQPKETKN